MPNHAIEWIPHFLYGIPLDKLIILRYIPNSNYPTYAILIDYIPIFSQYQQESHTENISQNSTHEHFLLLAIHHQGKPSVQTKNAFFSDLRIVANSDQQGGYRCKTCNHDILSKMIYTDLRPGMESRSTHPVSENVETVLRWKRVAILRDSLFVTWMLLCSLQAALTFVQLARRWATAKQARR